MGRIRFSLPALLLIALTAGCRSEPEAADGRIKVFVSIRPQVYFVDKIGGAAVSVEALVGPGQNPVTYEPTPGQMTRLSNSTLYFRIGVPFEEGWIEKIASANRSMRIVDLRERVPMREMVSHWHRPGRAKERSSKGTKDPHIWLSPTRVKFMAATIYHELLKEDRGRKDYYENNLALFHRELDLLDQEIREILKPLTRRVFIVYHPSWGYFAEDYGLHQIPIETEGKEPSGKYLRDLIALAKEEGIGIVIVQKQFNQKPARALASSIGGKVVQIDPLDGDYSNNLRNLATVLAKNIK